MAQKKQPAAQKKQPKPELVIEDMLIATKAGIKLVFAKSSFHTFQVQGRVLVLHNSHFDILPPKHGHYTVSDYLTGMMVANGFGKEKVIAEAKAKARKHNIGDLVRKQKLPEINMPEWRSTFLVAHGGLQLKMDGYKRTPKRVHAFLTAVKQFSETNPPQNGN